MITEDLKTLIDNKTKPPGSLGLLEDLALQIGEILGTTGPQLINPHLVVFAADHGIAKEGVSAFPQEVTRQMVLNFLNGGAAINVFCKQHDIRLQVIDAGVNFDFDDGLPLGDGKIAKGTASFLHGPAMTTFQAELCLLKGEAVVAEIVAKGCNVIGFGEMGIGNTSSAAVLMSLLCDLPLSECIGRGTGLNDEQLLKKQQILEQAVANYKGDRDIFKLMAYFGGFELMEMTGAILAAGKRKMVIMVDGFIATAAYLCAYRIDQSIKKNAVFCHESEEKGHRLLLAYLEAKPLLSLHLRLGEGTGCALAYPLLKSAVNFLNEMASFQSAAISNKS
ncbi:nicotinate-nucleotide--dimethylbenzimidazole phosphoribosyltransferase [Pedobacter cryoconitis]|uniref:Nicotinate-nucleotide--dimethylbenzimidazole phosphoribosyltransferase n=1 Tax=Pedobacter cryoconitis TaxID=188932 RepID=A0A127V9R2_9SPHI|nr:nicotinate-nucleotide--dimethylbenzimidazole phosphoribosyltransferase [Pedobacter cryoconitis]AMP97738.1 nicotinate-nucleotide--dimethylbenzimidazole phosphoribosyltransferase [Pedobacter cryoconitis]